MHFSRIFDFHHYWLSIVNLCKPQECLTFAAFGRELSSFTTQKDLWLASLLSVDIWSLPTSVANLWSLQLSRIFELKYYWLFFNFCHYYLWIVNICSLSKSLICTIVGRELLSFSVSLSLWPLSIFAFVSLLLLLVVNCCLLQLFKIFNLYHC